MAMYTLKTDSTHWNSANIYGSSRVGMYEPNKLIGKFGVKVTNSNNISTLTRGLRRYELSNHLGNVLAVISDKRTTVCNGVLINYYEAVVVYSTDYHAFGSSMAGRNFSNSGYKYGWNGKETEKEIFEGCITFEARIYNSHLGRFLSTDPRESEYPWQSTHVYFKNSPISVLDLLGKGGPFEDDVSDPSSSISNNLNTNLNSIDPIELNKINPPDLTTNIEAENKTKEIAIAEYSNNFIGPLPDNTQRLELNSANNINDVIVKSGIKTQVAFLAAEDVGILGTYTIKATANLSKLENGNRQISVGASGTTVAQNSGTVTFTGSVKIIQNGKIISSSILTIKSPSAGCDQNWNCFGTATVSAPYMDGFDLIITAGYIYSEFNGSIVPFPINTNLTIKF